MYIESLFPKVMLVHLFSDTFLGARARQGMERRRGNGHGGKIGIKYCKMLPIKLYVSVSSTSGPRKKSIRFSDQSQGREKVNILTNHKAERR